MRQVSYICIICWPCLLTLRSVLWVWTHAQLSPIPITLQVCCHVCCICLSYSHKYLWRNRPAHSKDSEGHRWVAFDVLLVVKIGVKHPLPDDRCFPRRACLNTRSGSEMEDENTINSHMRRWYRRYIVFNHEQVNKRNF